MQSRNSFNSIEIKDTYQPLHQYANILQNNQNESQTDFNNVYLNQTNFNCFNSLFAKEQSQPIVSFDNILFTPTDYNMALNHLQLQHMQNSSLNTNNHNCRVNCNSNGNGNGNSNGNENAYLNFITKNLQLEYEPLFQKELNYNVELLMNNIREHQNNNGHQPN